VVGDGSDWNRTELGILGDISIAVPVSIFDKGNHTAPATHAEPFVGTLVFTPGTLLRNGLGQQPADWAEITRLDGSLCPDGYYGLYERRLLPVLRHVDAHAATRNTSALLTIPGLGCGQFAGPFRGQLGAALQTVLERLLTTHGASLPNIKAVYYDPFNECANSRQEIHGISLMVRPLLQGYAEKSQLCPPDAYAEDSDDFSGCLLSSIVAWDHVSWPDNDFFAGSRCTDDGVKAAATNSTSRPRASTPSATTASTCYRGRRSRNGSRTTSRTSTGSTVPGIPPNPTRIALTKAQHGNPRKSHSVTAASWFSTTPEALNRSVQITAA
jgi:hypothetical protein